MSLKIFHLVFRKRFRIQGNFITQSQEQSFPRVPSRVGPAFQPGHDGLIHARQLGQVPLGHAPVAPQRAKLLRGMTRL